MKQLKFDPKHNYTSDELENLRQKIVQKQEEFNVGDDSFLTVFQCFLFKYINFLFALSTKKFIIQMVKLGRTSEFVKENLLQFFEEPEAHIFSVWLEDYLTTLCPLLELASRRDKFLEAGIGKIKKEYQQQQVENAKLDPITTQPLLPKPYQQSIQNKVQTNIMQPNNNTASIIEQQNQQKIKLQYSNSQQQTSDNQYQQIPPYQNPYPQMYPPMIPIDPRQLQYPSSQPQQQGQQTGQQYSTGSNQIPISPIAPIPSPYIHPLQQIPPIGYPPPIQGINQYQQGIQNPLPVPTQSLTNPYDPNYNQYNSQQTPDHDSSQIQKDENQKKLTRKEFEKEFIDENANLDSSFASSNKRLRLDNNIDGQGLFEQIFANAGYVNNYDENEESNGYFQQEKEQTSSLNESGVINWPAPCHYHPNCKNLACPFIHAPPCKNDKACTNPQCTFAHYTNLNSRPLCPYRTRCTKTNCTYRHLQPNQKNPFQSGRSLYFSDEAINSMASKKDSTSTVTQQEPEQQSITQDSFSNEKQQVSDKVETCQVNVENADQQSLHSNSKPPDELQTDNI